MVAGPKMRGTPETHRDKVAAAALMDRLVHHRHIVNIRGDSYRMREQLDLARALHVGRAAPETGDAAGRRTT